MSPHESSMVRDREMELAGLLLNVVWCTCTGANIAASRVDYVTTLCVDYMGVARQSA